MYFEKAQACNSVIKYLMTDKGITMITRSNQACIHSHQETRIMYENIDLAGNTDKLLHYYFKKSL